jgi:hypothetical protein
MSSEVSNHQISRFIAVHTDGNGDSRYFRQVKRAHRMQQLPSNQRPVEALPVKWFPVLDTRRCLVTRAIVAELPTCSHSSEETSAGNEVLV